MFLHSTHLALPTFSLVSRVCFSCFVSLLLLLFYIVLRANCCISQREDIKDIPVQYYFNLTIFLLPLHFQRNAFGMPQIWQGGYVCQLMDGYSVTGQHHYRNSIVNAPSIYSQYSKYSCLFTAWPASHTTVQY